MEARQSAPPFRALGFVLSTLGYASARAFRDVLAPVDLEPREFALLRAVGFDEGRSQQACGGRLHIPPSRMVALVDHLEERGLLERRANPDDRRAKALYLTPAGRAKLDEALERAIAHDRRLGAGLSDDERADLLELLGRVGANLGLEPGVHPDWKTPDGGG